MFGRRRRNPDLPHSVSPVHLRDLPDKNGDYARPVGYTTETEWYSVDHASGSDYHGGLVNRANHEDLVELLDEHHPSNAQPVVWALTSSPHSGYGVVVDWPNLDPEIQDVIGGLDAYPLISDDTHSRLKSEAEDDAWETWAEREFEELIEKALDLDEFPDSVDTFDLFRQAQDRANVYWEDTSEGIYIPIQRVADEALRLIREDPDWSKSFTPQWKGALAEIQAHRRRIGQAPLDPERAEWSEEDIIQEAARIRKLNPSQIQRLRRLFSR